MKKFKSFISAVTVFCLAITFFAGCSGKENKPNGVSGEASLWSANSADVSGGVKDGGVYKSEYVQPTQMPYYAEWVDKNYPRQKNVTVKNEGLSEYPVYGTVFKTTNAPERADVFEENMRLTSGDTTLWGNTASETPQGWPFYNMMDKNGNLLKINLATAKSPADAVDSGMDLYKHTASKGMYFGDVSDDEPAVMQGVRHSGPLKYAEKYGYDELTDVARLWEKIGMVSNKIPNWCNGGGNIIFTYDNYITAGDAFALTGHRNVVAPYTWMTAALDYKAFVSNGSWGNAHEYNHHYQKFGMSGDSNEITNNAVNLLEYALFTDISSQRTLTGTKSKEYWNAYTSPQYGLQYILNENKKAAEGAAPKHSSLHVYSTLLNNIGADAFIASALTGTNPAGYYRNLCNGTHLDMTYFFESVLNFSENDIGGADAVAQVKAKNYPVFVPVNTVYQVGRIWEKDGVEQYARTVRPFVYGTGNYTLDFENHLVIPQGFDYEIKDVTQPENGSVTVKDELHIDYTPSGSEPSGDFTVTLKVTKQDGAFAVNDVKLVINLQQEGATEQNDLYVAPSYLSHVYSYNHRESYADGQTLVESKFAASVNDNPIYDGKVSEIYSLNNIFDGDETNVFWSTGNTMGDRSYSEQNPFELTVDIGKTVTANTFTLYFPTESNFDKYYCTHFKVYAGETREDLKLVHSAENAQRAGNKTISVAFDEPVKLRYYKLVVTDAANRSDKQFAIRKLEWSYSVSGGNVISPDAKRLTYFENGRREEESAVKYTGNWSSKAAPSSFGTVKTGDASSSASFTFEGERIAVFSCAGLWQGTFEIYIDGEKACDAKSPEGGGKVLAFMSGKLGEGKHTVTVKGKTGEFNLDSFVIFA